MRVVLASSSPRRKELMQMFNIPFEVIPSMVEEKLDEKKNHSLECMKTAKSKALDVFGKIEGDVIVIGSDTIVSYQNKIYQERLCYHAYGRSLNCGY